MPKFSDLHFVVNRHGIIAPCRVDNDGNVFAVFGTSLNATVQSFILAGCKFFETDMQAANYRKQLLKGDKEDGQADE